MIIETVTSENLSLYQQAYLNGQILLARELVGILDRKGKFTVEDTAYLRRVAALDLRDIGTF